MTGPKRRPACGLARWRSACDRNQALAVADYLARVRQAAQATAEVSGTAPTAQICRDLGARARHWAPCWTCTPPGPPTIAGVDPAFPRIVSTGIGERLARPESAGVGGRSTGPIPAAVGERCRACASMLRHAGWPCATRRAIAHALDPWHVLL